MLSKSPFQFADERFELDLERSIVPIPLNQPYDCAPHNHRFHLVRQLRHVLRLRDTESHCERQVRHRAHRSHQRNHRVGQGFALAGHSGWRPDGVIVGNGSNELIEALLVVTIQPGTRVVLPEPTFTLYTLLTRILGGEVVSVPLGERFEHDPAALLRAARDAAATLVIACSPNNPTGALYSDELLRGIVAIAREHGLVIFADEVYDKVLYDGAKHTAIGSLSEDVLTLTFNSLSKSYRSCGYRAGWLVVSGDKKPAKDYIEGLNMLSNMRLCANVPGQWAVQTALGGYQSINELVGEGGRLRKQRDLAYELITAIPGVTCVKPQAALYMFPRLDPAVYPIEDDQQFFLELLQETKVMLVQGTGFNWAAPDHFRIVFLPHEDDLRDAIGRVARFLEQYRKRKQPSAALAA